MIRPPPRSTLFPCTTLFRSVIGHSHERGGSQPLLNLVGGHIQPRGNVRLSLGCVGGLTEVPLGHEVGEDVVGHEDRKRTRLNSSHANISYAVFCLKKKDSSA